MKLNVAYSGPAITTYQGQMIDKDTPITGAFYIDREDEHKVVLCSGQHNDQYEYYVARSNFEGRAVVYH